MAPPEMMNGSSRGSASMYSSMRSMRTGGSGRMDDIEEVQLSASPRQPPLDLEREHAGHQAILRVKEERVQCALRSSALDRRVLRERQLEKGVELDTLAAEAS